MEHWHSGEIGKCGLEGTSSLADAEEAITTKLGDVREGMFDAGADAALLLVGTFLFTAERSRNSTFFAGVSEPSEAFEQRRNERLDAGAVGPKNSLVVDYRKPIQTARPMEAICACFNISKRLLCSLPLITRIANTLW